MTRDGLSFVAVISAVLVSACAPPPPQAAPTPPRGDLVVLLPDPDDQSVGSATVTGAAGAVVELTHAHDGTRIVPGQAPTAPAPIPSADVQRIFGDALTARPPAPRRFILYFESGSETLTQDSQALVPEIITAVRTRPAPDVTVIGHTDTTGDAKTNVELGLRRASLIRDLLVASGLDRAQVDVASHGEADLLVPTPDATEEARNRRVEVTVR